MTADLVDTRRHAARIYLTAVVVTSLAGAVPAVLGFSARADYRHELDWYESASGLLDGWPDPDMLLRGYLGIGIGIGIALGSFYLVARTARSKVAAPRVLALCVVLSSLGAVTLVIGTAFLANSMTTLGAIGALGLVALGAAVVTSAEARSSR